MRCDRRTLALGLLAASAAAWAQTADAPSLRYAAPLSVATPGAFVRLPLSPEVYAKSREGALADLRLVDATGARVPFALLRARPDELGHDEVRQPVSIYPLPPQAAAETLPANVELQIEGGRLNLRTQGQAGTAPPAVAGGQRPGWLIDLGERRTDQPPPKQLELRWTGPAEFSAGYRLDAGADLRHWRPAGGGQVMALAGQGGNKPLTQPRVPLQPDAPRYLRLRWTEPAEAPAVTAADAIAEQPRSRSLDPPVTLRLSGSPEPEGPIPRDSGAPRALHLDLGGVLEVRDVDLVLPPGTQVLPIHLQTRNSLSEQWSRPQTWVYYRVERAASQGGADVPPPLTLNARARYIRLMPDYKVSAIDAERVSAVIRVQLASLVFAAQGTPPYRLQVGAPPKAMLADGALPLATLVPQLDAERPRFGLAALGAFTEQEAVAQQVARDEQLAAWRPKLLWAVLLAGVAGLGFMVWRLARGGAGKPDQTPR